MMFATVSLPDGTQYTGEGRGKRDAETAAALAALRAVNAAPSEEDKFKSASSGMLRPTFHQQADAGMQSVRPDAATVIKAQSSGCFSVMRGGVKTTAPSHHYQAWPTFIAVLCVVASSVILGSSGLSLTSELAKLGELRDQKILTESEFTAAKARLVNGGGLGKEEVAGIVSETR